jgi:hypothetical protein
MANWHKVHSGSLVLVLAMIGGGLFVLLSEGPDDSTVRDDTCSMARTRRIAEGLEEYRQANKAFPPSCTFSKNGTRLHSWRVLLLPYLGYDELYRSIDLSVPWDHPRNRHARDSCPELYRCFKPQEDAFTSHVAVAGAGTIWGLRDVDDQDGLSARKCVSIVVVGDSKINWMEPRDIEVSYGSWKEELRRVLQGSSVRVIRGSRNPHAEDLPADEILQDRKYIFVEPRIDEPSSKDVTTKWQRMKLRGEYRGKSRRFADNVAVANGGFTHRPLGMATKQISEMLNGVR